MNRPMTVYLLVIFLGITFQKTFAVLTMEEIIATAKILRNHCQPKAGATDEAIDNASNGDFADDRALKCYLSCMMGLSHAVKDGKYQADLTIQMADDLLPPDLSSKVKFVANKCRNAGDGIDDVCEMAITIAKCAFTADSELFYVP